MPRVGEPLRKMYPWAEWEKQLRKSPTKTLYFGPEDYAPLRSANGFKNHVRAAWGHLDASIALHGTEVVVTLNA